MPTRRNSPKATRWPARFSSPTCTTRGGPTASPSLTAPWLPRRTSLVASAPSSSECGMRGWARSVYVAPSNDREATTAQYYLGEAYLLDGRFDEAEQVWQNALTLIPGEPTLLAVLANLPVDRVHHAVKTKNWPGVLQELARLPEGAMPESERQTIKGDAYLALGQPDQARAGPGRTRSTPTVSRSVSDNVCASSVGLPPATCYNAQKMGGSTCKPRLTKSYLRCGNCSRGAPLGDPSGPPLKSRTSRRPTFRRRCSCRLYFKLLKIDPERPHWSDRDRFIMSKGHSAIGLYAVLALRGFLPVEELQTFDQINSRLQGHPDMTNFRGWICPVARSDKVCPRAWAWRLARSSSARTSRPG